MTIPRFFIAPRYINIETGTILYQDAKLTKQIRKVLRLGNGDRVDILDGQNNIYHCLLQNISPDTDRDLFQAHIESTEQIISQNKTRLMVAMPLIKANRFEWALEKLTELGADVITPVALERSVIKLNPSLSEHQAKLTRWQKIIQESAEQCERSSPPELMPPIGFLQWLDETWQKQNNILRIICTERLEVQPLEQVLYNQNSVPSGCAIALGAEGGLTEEEIEAALSHQFIPVSLGSLILRSETAAVYTTAIVNALLRLKSVNPAPQSAP